MFDDDVMFGVDFNSDKVPLFSSSFDERVADDDVMFGFDALAFPVA